MALSSDLISEFVKSTKDTQKTKSESTTYGTVVIVGDTTYVKMDGSSLLTPVTTTADTRAGERVTVRIKNHSAMVTGNTSSPAARTGTVTDLSNTVNSIGSSVSFINTTLNTQASTIETLNSKVETNNSSIETIKSTVETQSSIVSTLSSKVETQGSDISTISSDIKTINSTIETQKSDINTLSSKVSTQASTIETLNSTVSTQGTTISNLDTKIQNQNTTISNLNTTIENQGTSISNLNTTIESQNTKISSLDTSINTVKSSVDIYNSSFKIEDGVVTGIKGIDTEWISTADLEADHATITNLDATYVKTETLEASYITANDISAKYATITKLESDYITADTIASTYVTTDTLTSNYITTEVINANYATIDNLTSVTGRISQLETDKTTTNYLQANQATIDYLNSNYLTAGQIETDYIQADLGNFTTAMVGTLLAQSGLISTATISEGHVTGYLDSVEINANDITAGTLTVDRLVISGSDKSIMYAINNSGDLVSTNVDTIDGGAITKRSISAEHIIAESITSNELHSGSVTTDKILTGAVTADKITVSDLSALNATIGGYHITSNAIYSGSKSAVSSTSTGVYVDSTGQFAVGDGNNHIKYFLDPTDGKYKLEIAAEDITIAASNSSLMEELQNIRDEVTTYLHIESSAGTCFKNDNISTVLSAVVYYGALRITDITALKAAMGDTVYLQWSFKRINEETEYAVDSGDTRIGSDGFTFTISPDDVDAKATFYCTLIEEGE